MEVNEYRLKVQASLIALEEELSLGDDVVLRLEGSVVQRLEKDNNDGTIDVTFVVKGIIAFNETEEA